MYKRQGFPSLGRQGIASVSTILLNTTAGVYGDAAIAAMSIVNRFVMFINSSMIGFGQGFQPVCGFCFGAGRYSRVRQALSLIHILSMIDPKLKTLLSVEKEGSFTRAA